MTMRRRPQSGFTLVEVMIAITIMAVLAVMAWRGLDGVSRANSTLERRSEELGRLLRALDQLERDLAWRATTELPSNAITEAPRALRELGARTASTPPPPATTDLLPPALQARRQTDLPFFFEIVRAAPMAPGQWQRVQWWRRGNVLYRAAGPASASFPLRPPETGERVALLEGVSAFQLRAWEPGQGWRNLPAASPARASATGLELTLDVREGGDGVVRTFQRVFALD